jgi:Predicted transcriptional regulator
MPVCFDEVVYVPALWTVNEAFGDYMRRKRLERNFTLEQVADLLETKHSTIQRYESGARYVNYDVALRWAEALGIPRAQVTSAWIAANGGEQQDESEITYVSDPDTMELIDSYEGITDPSRRELARRLVEEVRRSATEDSIGGGSTTRKRAKKDPEE